MTLDIYIKQSKIDKYRFADEIGVGLSALQHWINGTRQPSALHSIKIEKITNGAVTRHDLRPDIYPLEEEERK